MRPRLLTALGLFLFVSAVYVAAGPGRIDIIDGQYRFEVAKNIVEDRSIQIEDPFLGNAVNGVLGAYSPYGLSGSLTGVPLVTLAGLFPDSSRDRQQFLFSFTSGLFGAATIALLFLFLTDMGISSQAAMWWSLVAAFATLAFPVATSTFDQTQHGFFVLAACLCAYLSARRDSLPRAAASGALLAFLVNFQQTYAVIVPAIALAALAPVGATGPDRRRGFERAAVVVFAGAFGMLIWMGINSFRFGSLFYTGQLNAHHPPVLGNPLIGLPGLLISPGKSIFLYSPPTILALMGFRRLFARERRVAQASAAATILYVGMVSCLTFFSGDWCWGPRYFASVLPLMALGFPFVALTSAAVRAFAVALVLSGLCIQALALSVDHHRFFYTRSLPTFFWYTNPGYYFHESALFARPREVLDLLKGLPSEADTFRPGPYAGQLTYAVFGGWGHPDLPEAEWVRRYQVFWLPRPWPLWMAHVRPEARPINLAMVEAAIAAIAGAGLAGLWLGRSSARGT